MALELWLPCLVVVAWWQLSATSESLFFPSLQSIIQTLSDEFLSERVTGHLLPSLRHFAVGYGLAVVVGVGAGLLIALNRWLDAITYPFIHFLRALPPPALLPFAIIFLGIRAPMKVALIAFSAVFPIILNTIDGVRGTDPVARETARSYHLPFWLRIWKVVLPGAAPQIFAGMRVALAVAVLLMVVSEMVASTAGLGHFILHSQQTFAIRSMWAGIIVLGLLGYLLNGLFLLIERRVLAWYYATRDGINV